MYFVKHVHKHSAVISLSKWCCSLCLWHVVTHVGDAPVSNVCTLLIKFKGDCLSCLGRNWLDLRRQLCTLSWLPAAHKGHSLVIITSPRDPAKGHFWEIVLWPDFRITLLYLSNTLMQDWDYFAFHATLQQTSFRTKSKPWWSCDLIGKPQHTSVYPISMSHVCRWHGRQGHSEAPRRVYSLSCLLVLSSEGQTRHIQQTKPAHSRTNTPCHTIPMQINLPLLIGFL